MIIIQKTAVFIIRTKLQLVIAETVRRSEYLMHKTVFVVTAPTGKELNALETMALEVLLEKPNVDLAVLDQSLGFVQYIAKLRYIIRKKAGSKIDALLLASIDCTRLSIITQLLKPLKLETFDDGSANYNLKSLYFKRADRVVNIRTLLKKICFPVGVQGYFRSKTEKHYTIFDGPVNIIKRQKRIYFDCKWTDYLMKDDFKFLGKNFNFVLLGTVFSEAGMKYDQINSLKLPDKEHCLAIAHPRSDMQYIGNLQFHCITGCVESIIEQVQKNINGRIKVMHFGSSVRFTMSSNKSLEFIDLIDSNKAKVQNV